MGRRLGTPGGCANAAAMVSNAPIRWGRLVAQALLAGVAAGVSIQLYLWLTTILPQHGSILAAWQFIASTLFGKVAFTSLVFAWLGLAIHLVISIGWAGGYTYLAVRQAALNQRWFASGLLYGIVVYVTMQLILLAGNAFRPPPDPTAFLNLVVAHTFFFGLPIAYTVKLLQQPRNA
jgi:hypothetical protein